MRTVKIGPLTYTVTEDYPLIASDGEMLYGEIAYEACTIRISSRAAEGLKPVILWHEILHGILSQAGLEMPNEEAVAEALSHGIVQVLQDRPELGDMNG